MSNSKKQMVVGFMFNQPMTRVVLIRKEKPAWQKGKYNGVGGKLEDSDKTHHHAMSREFREETTMVTEPADWLHYGRMEGPDWVVELFAARHLEFGEPPVRTVTAERVELPELRRLPEYDADLLNDVMWMVHAARFALYPGGPKWVEANYEDIHPESFEAFARGRGIKFPSRVWDVARADWDRARSGATPGDVPEARD